MSHSVPRATRLAGLAAVAGCVLALPAAAAAKADLSGFWILQSDPMAVPAARLTAAATAELRKIEEGQGLDVKAGSPAYANLWCTVQGMPWQETFRLPLDIRQSPIEVTILPSVRAESRHIYTDGQKHPDPATFDQTTVGHSIGRWQGDTLVADTVGFSDKGVRLIPGGGLRGPTSHLVQRYRLAGPDTLKVSYTWTDRAALKQPHSYTYTYARAKGPVWMTEPNCNPIRAMRAKGLKLPPDAPAG